MLPEAFLERMQQMLGEEYGTFLETFAQERFHALRLNPLKLRVDGRSAVQVLGGEADGQSAALSNDSISAQETSGVNRILEKAGESGSGKTWKPQLSKVPWAENGYYYLAEDFPGKHPYHEAGLYYIQEPSAMAPVELLDVRPGERVLDLCAAPGGKSTQAAAKMKGNGILICNEIHSARAKILSENIERMGVCNACVTNETPERLSEFFSEYFDRILVDAPCSGEGMFRKNETACEEWSLENAALCADRQDRILDCAAEMLRPGGRLVYSTCTFAPEENEGSVSRFLQRRKDFKIVPVSPMEKEKLGLGGCDGMPEYLEAPSDGLENTLRLWPHRIKGEGHFAAVLEKAGERPQNDRSSAVNGNIMGIDWKELPDFVDFCRESFGIWGTWKKNGSSRIKSSKSSGRSSGQAGAAQADVMLKELGGIVGMGGELQIIRFGDNLYIVPAQMPALKGLKVLRPGLHLGELKKNRFEPSHALALAVRPERAVHRWNLDAEGRTVRAYLNGETFPAEGEKGWYLICADGFGVGWGRLAGEIMKNHYPKGLRRNLDAAPCAGEAKERKE